MSGVGRKKRITRYISAALRRTKNIGTRRTKIAIVHRDIRKLSAAKQNKRLSK